MTLRLSTVRKWIVYLLVVYVFFYPHITVMLGGVALYPILFTIIGLSLLTILHGNRHGIRMSLLSTEWLIILVMSSGIYGCGNFNDCIGRKKSKHARKLAQ